MAVALAGTATVHQLRREAEAVHEQANAMIALSTEQEFPFALAVGTALRGWALAEQEQREEGMAQMSQGLSALRATGAEVLRSHFLALLARAYGKVGQAEGGLRVLAEALTGVDKSGERFHEAELYRLKGELSLQSRQVQVSQNTPEATSTQSPIPNPQTEAEACFLKAIDIARHQQAKSLELRAVMSLSRLWQQQVLEPGARSAELGAKSEAAGKRESVEARTPELGPSLLASQRSSFELKKQEAHSRLAEAHKMLSEVYNWFTEGFDTADLNEAQALLKELS